ncbi:TetR/AcrR family transcriptional regulator C-terminal domain-containing protein [Nocardia gamkensis]|uniref:TetR/AcrR family transcriptional regulator n=1 Tax=Nocardia gamkensis TaxID=352869 RepID=UPI0033DC31CF
MRARPAGLSTAAVNLHWKFTIGRCDPNRNTEVRPTQITLLCGRYGSCRAAASTPAFAVPARRTSAKRSVVGRSKRARRDLTRTEVLEAAVVLVERDGIAALTMRRLAAEVGVEPMSLYNHVTDKEAVLDGMVDVVLDRLTLPQTSADWEADVLAFAHAFRAVARRYPTTAPLVLTRQTYSPALMRAADAAVGRLLMAGFDSATAVHALRALLACIVGTLLREVGASPTLGGDNPDERDRRRDLIIEGGLPNLTIVADELSSLDHSFEFDFAISAVVASLRSLRFAAGT